MYPSSHQIDRTLPEVVSATAAGSLLIQFPEVCFLCLNLNLTIAGYLLLAFMYASARIVAIIGGQEFCECFCNGYYFNYKFISSSLFKIDIYLLYGR